MFHLAESAPERGFDYAIYAVSGLISVKKGAHDQQVYSRLPMWRKARPKIRIAQSRIEKRIEGLRLEGLVGCARNQAPNGCT